MILRDLRTISHGFLMGFALVSAMQGEALAIIFVVFGIIGVVTGIRSDREQYLYINELKSRLQTFELNSTE